MSWKCQRQIDIENYVFLKPIYLSVVLNLFCKMAITLLANIDVFNIYYLNYHLNSEFISNLMKKQIVNQCKYENINEKPSITPRCFNNSWEKASIKIYIHVKGRNLKQISKQIKMKSINQIPKHRIFWHRKVHISYTNLDHGDQYKNILYHTYILIIFTELTHYSLKYSRFPHVMSNLQNILT